MAVPLEWNFGSWTEVAALWCVRRRQRRRTRDV